MKTLPAGKEHVTIAVSGAYGGATVDFRKLANRGMVLLGMTEAYDSGVISIADDLAKNIANGDANYLGYWPKLMPILTPMARTCHLRKTPK